MNPRVGDIAAAVIESERVERTLASFGFDRLAIVGIQQEIADLAKSTQLSWREATDHVLDRILAPGYGGTD